MEVYTNLQGRLSASDAFPRLHYTKAIRSEAMRLYPPVWLITRRALANETLGGYLVRAGTDILISPLLPHRHPTFWPEPDSFLPERFASRDTADSNSAGDKTTIARPHRYQYLPFGAGPRLCIGDSFAKMEGLLILTTLVQRCRFSLATPAMGIKLNPQATLQPKNGLPMIVSLRAQVLPASPLSHEAR